MSTTDPKRTRLADPVTEKDHIQGPFNAPITLVEYGDYECPHCLHAHPIIKQIQQNLGDRLRLVYRNFPQNSVHPHASVAAQAAEAAGAQGKFWPMHDLFFEHQADLGVLDLSHAALRLGLEVYRFESDLSSETFSPRVRHDFQGGLRSGVTGTPAFFINEVRYLGPIELGPLQSALLSAPAPSVPASVAPSPKDTASLKKE